MEKEKHFVSGRKMAEILGVSYFSLMKWAGKQQIPSLKVGRVRRFDPDSVIKFLSQQEETIKLLKTPKLLKSLKNKDVELLNC